MPLKSALQDVKETTLRAVSGLLGKLAYLASLRHGNRRYEHWGMEAVHGAESSEKAIRTAHAEVVASVLRAPLSTLIEDLRESSGSSGIAASAYVEELRGNLDNLLPDGRQNATVSTQLNSVLQALSSLERNRGRATRSTS